MQRGLSIYKGINLIILLFGMVLLVLQGMEFNTWRGDSNVWEGMPLMYGKKLDPYQDDPNRLKQIKLVTRSGVSVSLIVSVYLIGKVLSDTFPMPSVEILLNSIYFQVIALLGIGGQLNTLKLEDTNFDVYKVNGEEN